MRAACPPLWYSLFYFQKSTSYEASPAYVHTKGNTIWLRDFIPGFATRCSCKYRRELPPPRGHSWHWQFPLPHPLVCHTWSVFNFSNTLLGPATLTSTESCNTSSLTRVSFLKQSWTPSIFYLVQHVHVLWRAWQYQRHPVEDSLLPPSPGSNCSARQAHSRNLFPSHRTHVWNLNFEPNTKPRAYEAWQLNNRTASIKKVFNLSDRSVVTFNIAFSHVTHIQAVLHTHRKRKQNNNWLKLTDYKSIQ